MPLSQHFASPVLSGRLGEVTCEGAGTPPSDEAVGMRICVEKDVGTRTCEGMEVDLLSWKGVRQMLCVVMVGCVPCVVMGGVR